MKIVSMPANQAFLDNYDAAFPKKTCDNCEHGKGKTSEACKTSRSPSRDHCENWEKKHE